MYEAGWKTNFDFKITSVTVYATYSDGRQEKHSFPLGTNFDKIPVTYFKEMPASGGGGKLAIAKEINAYEECNEWFSFKEGYGIRTFPEVHQKIEQIYNDVMSKDYFGDVFFTFELSIMLDPIKPGDLLPDFPLGGLF